MTRIKGRHGFTAEAVATCQNIINIGRVLVSLLYRQVAYDDAGRNAGRIVFFATRR